MINIRNLNNSNSQIEISDRVSEVNMYTSLSSYNKSKPEVTVECDSSNTVKLLDGVLVYSSQGYKHYINLNNVTVVTFKKLDKSFDSTCDIAYIYESLTNYNSEKAIEVPYIGAAKEYLCGTDKFMILEDKEYLHLLNVNKVSAVVVKNSI